MFRRACKLSFWATALAFLTLKPAAALEPLNYTNSVGPSLSVDIDSYLQSEQNTQLSNYDLALNDLNGDQNDEFFLKPKWCAQANQVCTYLILALSGEKIILLSSIRAKSIMVGATQTHHVKDLLIFDKGSNDYDFDIYMWSPAEKMYILKGE